MAEKILAMPKGPRFRATRRATACLVLSASIAIAGCAGEPVDRGKCLASRMEPQPPIYVKSGAVLVPVSRAPVRRCTKWEYPNGKPEGK